MKSIVTKVADDVDVLCNGIDFEEVTQGRKAAILLKYDKEYGIPVVRSTTVYRNAPYLLEEKNRYDDLCPFKYNNAMNIVLWDTILI